MNVTIGNKFVEIRVDAEQTLECYQNWEGDYEIRVDTLQALEYHRQSGGGIVKSVLSCPSKDQSQIYKLETH